MGTENTNGTEPKKPGIFRRAGSYLYHTLADDANQTEDRDLFQVIADSVMGPTPGRKAARSATVVGGGVAVAGIVSGSVTTLTIGGITFVVGGVAEGVQWLRGRKQELAEGVDAPQVMAKDEDAVESVGMAEAGKAKNGLHAILKMVATGEVFQLSERRFEQLWGKANSNALNPKDKQLYNSVVRLAERDGLVTVAS